MLTEEKINFNFVTFVKRLKKYKIYTEKMESDEEFNLRLKNATAFITADTNLAYDGSLIEHIIDITSNAISLNNTLLDKIKVDQDSLIRTCLLHQISKSLMFVKNDVEWEIGKGKLYKYSDNLPAIRCGEFSIYLAMKYGVELSVDEFESILSMDKKDDDQKKYHKSVLSTLLEVANDLAIKIRK